MTAATPKFTAPTLVAERRRTLRNPPELALVPKTRHPPPSPYRSFWMGGFEGADHVNGLGKPLDLVRANLHDAHVEEDYRRAADMGLKSVRESVGWRLAEPSAHPHGSAAWRSSTSTPASRFDFSRVARFAEVADRQGVQVLWTLMHYGTPADVNILDDSFIPRFADFAAAAARVISRGSAEPAIYNPINEIGFLAWAVSQTNLIHPYRGEAALAEHGRDVQGRQGWDVKCRLVKATLQAIEAIRAEDPRARFLQAEPLIHVVAPEGAPHLADRAAEQRSFQWQAWDMIRGTLAPELGGHAAALDLIGVNYYHDGQTAIETGERLEWHLNDPRRAPFASLLREAWQRYGRALLIAETSHVGSGRAQWLDEVAREVETARKGGVPIDGVCLYPAVDRPDWSDPGHWHKSGLWDVEVGVPAAPGTMMRRRLHLGYAKSLRRSQRRLP